ncbi:MAG TPA: NEW3 domain-containing protein, partial [Methanocella sp.]|nr:NEW3 domain-containing protein [Methanocella sp.]
AGSTTNFVLTAENSYAVGKDMQLLISDIPPGWNVDTDNGTEFYIPAGKTASTDLNVYIPKDTAPGNYTINATLNGSDTKPAGITLKVRVEGTPYYDAIIMNSNRTPEGYPEYNLSPGEPLTIPVRVYNSWKFPITIQANAEIGENWPYYLDGIPGGRIRIEPGKASEFYVKTAVPNSSYGNYTARVHLESTDQDLTLTGQIMVPSPTPKPESTATNTGWTGPAITGLTTGAILITLGASILRKLRK